METFPGRPSIIRTACPPGHWGRGPTVRTGPRRFIQLYVGKAGARGGKAGGLWANARGPAVDTCTIYWKSVCMSVGGNGRKIYDSENGAKSPRGRPQRARHAAPFQHCIHWYVPNFRVSRLRVYCALRPPFSLLRQFQLAQELSGLRVRAGPAGSRLGGCRECQARAI
jgi:hypothetical protein